MVDKTDMEIDDEIIPVTTTDLVGQLKRIGIRMRVKSFHDWTQSEKEAAYNWAIQVDMALNDGFEVLVTKRPRKLAAVLFTDTEAR